MKHYDDVIETIAAFALSDLCFSDEAYETNLASLMDAVGCGLLALNHKAALNILEAPFDTGANGIRIPGTLLHASPMQAAFSIGALNRWLDYNDTWLAKEWGHPSDNFGALLVAGLHNNAAIYDVITAGIIAYEIQGVLALSNAFNQVGLDHVLLVKIASIAAAGRLLGFSLEQLKAAISQGFVDGQALRTYRHFPNTGSRKSWAAGDASARALRLLWMTAQGEPGYRTALSAPKWGFEDVLYNGEKVTISQNLSDYVATNILFKVSYPAEFHAQTAIEAALKLKPLVNNIDDIAHVKVQTQKAGMQIISKKGVLSSPADRDHCLEYMVAVALMDGQVTDQSYVDSRAEDPALECLREKIECEENPLFTQMYFDPNSRAIPNSVQITFKNGETTQQQVCEYPLGHRTRRQEAQSPLFEKFITNASSRYADNQITAIVDEWKSKQIFDLTVGEFFMLWPNSFETSL